MVRGSPSQIALAEFRVIADHIGTRDLVQEFLAFRVFPTLKEWEMPKLEGEKKKGEHSARMNLVHVIRMLEEVGTGGAGYRFVYSAFLQEAAEKTGFTVLNDYSLRLSEIGDQWRDFAYKASRVYKKRGKNTNASDQLTYNELADLLQAIGEKEQQFFFDLDEEVKQLSTINKMPL